MKVDVVFKNGVRATYETKSNSASDDLARWVLDMGDNVTFGVGGLVVKRSEIAAIQFVEEGAV